jgi:hypothetical protein
MGFVSSLSLTRLVLPLVALSAIVGLAPRASAQYGEAAGIADAMTPEYFRRDVTLFANALGMDDNQQFILETLFDDYQADFDAGVEAMQEQFRVMQEDLKDAPQEAVMERVFQPFKDWAVDRQRLGDQFLENVRLLLSPTQQEAWPRFEQELMREKHLMRGKFAGESVNLFHVLRDLNLAKPVEQSIQSVVTAYGDELHAALRYRRDVFISTQRELLDSLAKMDTASGMASMVRQIEARVRVRDVNDKFITLITDALPDPQRAEFRRTALERAYPAVYRETPYERLFRDAMALESMTDDVRSAIDNLLAAYMNELSAINDQLAKVKRDHEPVAEKERIEAFEARQEDKPFDRSADPSKLLFDQRQELGIRYLKALQSILTPEQFDQLPGAHRWLNAGVRTCSMRPDGSGIGEPLRHPSSPPPGTHPKAGKGGKTPPGETAPE